MQMSQLHLHSMGTVAANKPLNSNKIEVMLDEHNPYVSGEITDQTSTYTGSGTDANGQAYQDTHLQTLTVSASWMPGSGGGNRLTAPDVRRGARVEIWKYEQLDVYFWKLFDDDTQKRKLETVTYAWSGTTQEFPDDNPANVSPENYYMLQVSTHTGQISLYTSKANGELTAYQVQFNTKDGIFTLMDDLGFSMHLDSTKFTFQISNQTGSFFNMVNGDISIYAAGNLRLGAGGNFQNDVKGTITTNSPKSNLNGDVNVNGALGMNGDVTSGPTPGGTPGTPGTGTMKIAKAVTFQDTVAMEKTLNVTGTITTPVPITAPNVN